MERHGIKVDKQECQYNPAKGMDYEFNDIYFSWFHNKN